VRTLLSILSLFALAFAIGCSQSADSTGDFEGAKKDVAQVVEDLQDASVDDDPQKICNEILAPALVRTAEGGCVRAIDQALKDADTYELEVTDVRITGANARARVEAGRDKDQVETIELVKVGRAWKISRLAGTAR
jgi:hypothetical protein